VPQAFIHSFDLQKVKDVYANLIRRQEADLTDTEAAVERIRANQIARVSFFEKLIVLDTGTFALTISFLSILGSHSGASQIRLSLLYVGWFSILMSVALAAIHNWISLIKVDNDTHIITRMFSSFRNDLKAQHAAQYAKIFQGRVTDEDGSEVLDLGLLFNAMASVIPPQYRAAANKDRTEAEEAQKRSTAGHRITGWSGRLAILTSFIALLIFLIWTMQNSWVLLQPPSGFSHR
jgi:hypothetical protein